MTGWGQYGQPPERKSWLRRHRFRVAFSVLALALIAAGILRAWPSGPGGGDYRDPARLAQAIKDAEHANGASCGKLPTGKYLCVAAFTNGTAGTYTVTVSADGRSYSAS